MANAVNKFSVYTKRESASRIDWSKVASDLSTKLQDISTERTSKKQVLEDVNLTTQTELNKQQETSNKTLGTLVIGMSGDSGAYLKVQYGLMKKGLITPNDFLQRKQTISGEWSSFSSAVKTWNADWETAMERVQDDSASGVEIAMNEWNDQFGNINQLKGFINPETGAMSLVLPNEDGTIPSDKTKHLSVASMNARVKDKINKVIVTDKIKAEVDALGEWITTESGGAWSVRTIDDIRNSTRFKETVEGIVSAQTSNNRVVSSILYDNVGGYEVTRDPKKANDKTILLVEGVGGLLQPELSETQKQAARDYVESKIESQLGHKEKQSSKQQDQERLARVRDELKDKNTDYTYLQDMNTLMSGNIGDARAMLSSIAQRRNEGEKDKAKRIVPGKTKRTDRGFTIWFEDGHSKNIPAFIEGDDGEFKRDPEGNKIPIDKKILLQNLNEHLAPEGGPSFQEVYDKYQEKGGVIDGYNPESFTGETIKKDKVVKNVDWARMYADPLQKNPSSVAAQFKALGGDIHEAASVTETAIGLALKGTGLDFIVKGINDWGRTNTLKITIGGETTTILYDNDNAKFAGQIRAVVNRVINKHNDDLKASATPSSKASADSGGDSMSKYNKK